MKGESQNKDSEAASENIMDDRSRKWEDGRRLEREGDEVLELLVKYEKRKKKAEERWTKWEDRQRLERQCDEIS